MSKVVVQSVNPGSTGESAGVQPGDIVIKVYGISVESRTQLIETMKAQSQENDSLSIEVERDGENLTLSHSEPSDSLGCYVKDESAGTTPDSIASGKGRSYLLGFAGIIVLIAGSYFLFFSQGETVNLHRLTIGQTLAIIGAIFIAVEWRPNT